jgi:diphthamide biosynthesis enzyme Dph1/Dph2-like protein
MENFSLDELFPFVLGDTSYGECCVDEVNAQHLNADIIVHFGETCCSKNKSNTIFMLAQDNFDTSSLLQHLTELESVLVLGDSSLNNCIEKFGQDH